MWTRMTGRSPSNSMSGFLLSRFAGVGGVGVVESLAIDVLRMLRQHPLKIFGEIGVPLVRHGGS